jgi:glycosyltransferase involved in cell wall biosynthesis
MISQTERKKMLQIFPWLSKKIMIINNSHPWDFNSIESNNYDMHIGSSEDAFKSSLRLIYTGGGERRKNIDLLLRAITLLQPKFSKLELWVTGDRSAFMATASADLLSLVDARVTYLGSLSDIELRHAYQRADVVVYPSLYEGYGRVVADAIVMKKPIVTLRLAVFQEFFGNYPVYADNNADSFAEAVESAKKNGLNRNSPKLVSAEESYTQFKKVVDSLC